MSSVVLWLSGQCLSEPTFLATSTSIGSLMSALGIWVAVASPCTVPFSCGTSGQYVVGFWLFVFMIIIVNALVPTILLVIVAAIARGEGDHRNRKLPSCKDKGSTVVLAIDCWLCKRPVGSVTRFRVVMVASTLMSVGFCLRQVGESYQIRCRGLIWTRECC